VPFNSGLTANALNGSLSSIAAPMTTTATFHTELHRRFIAHSFQK
jgi:hypothetical protein